MPPRPKYSREEILDAAYALLEEGGMDAVVAREVGRRLGCTVAPIFTCFDSMEDLRAALHEKAMARAADYLVDCVDYFPAFKEFGLRWVRLAREHPHVYSEVFLQREVGKTGSLFHDDLWQMLAPILAEVTATFGISREDAAQIVKDLLIYVHGLAAIQIGGHGEMTEAELRVTLSRLCLSCVAGVQARDGCINEAQLRMMLAHMDMTPVRKDGQGAPCREDI